MAAALSLLSQGLLGQTRTCPRLDMGAFWDVQDGQRKAGESRQSLRWHLYSSVGFRVRALPLPELFEVRKFSFRHACALFKVHPDTLQTSSLSPSPSLVAVLFSFNRRVT